MTIKVIVLLTAAVLALSLVACGDQKAAKTEEKAAPAAEQSAAAPPAAGEQAAPAAEQAAAAPDEVTVSGTVAADGKITADDGQAYSIADTDMGKEVLNLAGKKVELKGTVTEAEGAKKITVIEYKAIN